MQALYDLNLWRGLEQGEMERLAMQVAKQLPQSFQFSEVIQLEGQLEPHWCAFFNFIDSNTRFALIPGAKASVGLDLQRFCPTQEQSESYIDTAQEYGLPPLNEFLEECTSRRRSVSIRPLLVATKPFEIGYVPVPIESIKQTELTKSDANKTPDANDTPSTKKTLGANNTLGATKVESSFSSDLGPLRVVKDKTGKIIQAGCEVPVERATLLERFSRDGFRLATEDEWEYFCGAGAETLFRWGDDCPCDYYPYRDGQGSFYPNFAPNEFGLTISNNTYNAEIVAETGVTKGGDGGGAICGGAGFFVGWLPLATSYRSKITSGKDGNELPLEYEWVRPVFELPTIR